MTKTNYCRWCGFPLPSSHRRVPGRKRKLCNRCEIKKLNKELTRKKKHEDN